MKKAIPVVTAAALLFSGAAWAQAVVVSPEDQIIIREYVVKQPPAVVELPSDYDIVVGAELPDTITLTPLAAPGLTMQYEYVAVGDDILLVEPGTRRIVDVLRRE
ncbi:MAG: DUF1236 domain-containing protein [Rhizobiaceae bacterium]|nr:DUF1236 domain-containing protein [Rhizobiaceae bacterium]